MIEKYVEKTESDKESILSETKGLLKSIDVSESSETEIGSFFEGLNKYDEKDKLQLLHDVLQEGEITIGNGGKNLKDVAGDFSRYVEQDWNSRKLKVKETLPGEKQYLQQFLNQTNSSLAYLIQRTANFINYEASRGYGARANEVERIAEDRILGNQTRRSLEGLKAWINKDNVLSFDESKEYKGEDIKAMKFISKDFLTSLKEGQADLFTKFWEEKDGKFIPAEGYKFVQEWSNNYAVKSLEATDEDDKDEEVASSIDWWEAPVDLTVDRVLAEMILSEITNNGCSLDFFGESREITIKTKSTTETVPTGTGRSTTTRVYKDYEQITLSIGNKSTSIQVTDLLNRDGNFDINKWNRKLWEQKEILKNKLIAQTIADTVKGQRYSVDKIFPNWSTMSAWVQKSKITRYFKDFGREQLRIHPHPMYVKEGDWKLFIRLDDSRFRGDRDHNRPDSNPKLVIDAAKYSEFLPNGQFNETKFLEYLQEVVLDIVENYADKF